MTRVLIIGSNYRPEVTGIAPYTSAMAEHLSASGHAVTVLTGFPHYPSWRLAAGEHRLRTTEKLGGVRVLRRRHFVPRTQTALGRGLYEATFLAHGFASRPERPDVIIGVSPSLSSAALARLYAARVHAPYGVIIQDLMGRAAEQSGIRGGGRVAGLTSALECWSLSRARLIGIASESFRPYLIGLGLPEARIVSTPNWAHIGTSKSDRAAVRQHLNWPSDTTIVLHAGNMGLKQGLEQVIAAARFADKTRAPVRYVLMGDGSQRANLEAMAVGIERLEFLPFQPERDLADVLGAADVCLVSERSTVIDMSLPSKLTTYFASGRPVVAAVPDRGATAREIRRSGGGLVTAVAAPADLQAAVAQLRADPGAADAYGRAGRVYAEAQLGSGQALARIDEFVGQVLGTTATGRG